MFLINVKQQNFASPGWFYTSRVQNLTASLILMDSVEHCFRHVWSWIRVRIHLLWSLIKKVFDLICCCSLCLSDNEPTSIDLERGFRNSQTVHPFPSSEKKQQQMVSGSTAQPGGFIHKLIMVGSGGVGKSALTLQFMYDEVSCFSF